MTRPAIRPKRPNFASGPCAKPPHWEPGLLSGAALGRYHRSQPYRTRLRDLAARIRALLEIPDSHRILIVPGSDTGAVECAMWNLLGPRGADVLAFDHFGHQWAVDILHELKLTDVRVHAADYGGMSDLSAWDAARDLVFCWTGTTAGTCVPDGDFIPDSRAGLTICDATAAVFSLRLPWDKLDAATFSWQKAMGGEAQHGVLVLGPRARERLAAHVPVWPMPKLFRIAQEGVLDESLTEGGVINTPSLLSVEDALVSLKWIESVGGLDGMIARARVNRAILDAWIDSSVWAAHLADDPQIRAPTPVAMRFRGPVFEPMDVPARRRAAGEIAALLEAEDAAYDIEAYRHAPPGLRMWTGGTVEAGDLEALLPWLDWAYEEVAGGAAHGAAGS